MSASFNVSPSFYDDHQPNRPAKAVSWLASEGEESEGIPSSISEQHQQEALHASKPMQPVLVQDLSEAQLWQQHHLYWNLYLVNGSPEALQKAIHLADALTHKSGVDESKAVEAELKAQLGRWHQGQVPVFEGLGLCNNLATKHAHLPVVQANSAHYLYQARLPQEAIKALDQAVSQAPWQQPYFRLQRACLLLRGDTPGFSPWNKLLGGGFDLVLGLALAVFSLTVWKNAMHMALYHMFTTNIPLLRQSTFLAETGKQLFPLETALGEAQTAEEKSLLRELTANSVLPYKESAYNASLIEETQVQVPDPQLYRQLSKAYLREGRQKEATHALENLLQFSPQEHSARLSLARLYQEQGQWFAALQQCRIGLEHAPEESQSPEEAQWYALSAKTLEALQDIEGAMAHYHKALELGPEGTWLAGLAHHLAELYQSKKQDDVSAIALLQFSLQHEREHAPRMAQLAELFSLQGDYLEAAKLYKKLLHHYPNNADLYSYLGYLLWQLDYNTEAKVAYEKALSLEPDNPISHNNLGVILLDSFELPEKAIQHFEKALQQEEAYVMATFNLGRCHQSLGHELQAREAYCKAIKLNTQQPELEHGDIEVRLIELFQVQSPSFHA